MENVNNKNILLGLLPFWDAMIPPLGISCLKAVLREQGYRAGTIDANSDPRFREIYYGYFDLIQQQMAEETHGHIHHVGHDVLRNHMQAHLDAAGQDQYPELVRVLIQKTFYVDFPQPRVRQLIELVDRFYRQLEQHLRTLLEHSVPDVLGLTVYSDTLAASLFAFKLVKKLWPRTLTIMGGGVFADLLSPGSPNLETFLEKTNGIIDKIIIGEGESLFLELLRGTLPEGRRVFGIQDLREGILDISRQEVPIPDFTDYNLSAYLYLAMSSYASVKGLPARPGVTISQPAMIGIARRVEEAIAALATKPDPKIVTLQLDELDGLRLTVALRPDGIHLSSSGDATLTAEIERALATRGFDMASGNDREGQRSDQGADNGWRPQSAPPGRLRTTNSSDIRL